VGEGGLLLLHSPHSCSTTGEDEKMYSTSTPLNAARRDSPIGQRVSHTLVSRISAMKPLHMHEEIQLPVI
jgi:hypothetical protein